MRRSRQREIALFGVPSAVQLVSGELVLHITGRTPFDDPPVVRDRLGIATGKRQLEAEIGPRLCLLADVLRLPQKLPIINLTLQELEDGPSPLVAHVAGRGSRKIGRAHV